jgi:hypothetical protein
VIAPPNLVTTRDLPPVYACFPARRRRRSPSRFLLASVRFRVVPRRMLRVLGRMQMMRVRHVRVVCGLLVIAALVRLRGFGVVMGSLRVMMGRLLVMLDCML